MGRAGPAPDAGRHERRIDPPELALELGLDMVEEGLKTLPVEHVFEARLVAVGAVPLADEDTHDGVGDGGRLGGRQDDAGVPRKVAVARDASQDQAEIDARAGSARLQSSRPSSTCTAWKPMSLVSSSVGIGPPPS